MVFQNYALYPHMTVAENIGFGLKMAGMSRRDVEARVADAARSLHIEPLLDRRPAQLSGGQRQRVAIGRAIVREPSVFLFDEPLSNLDAELRVIMRVEIAKLHRQLGATMIYVTHDQVEAMTLADRIVVLRAGRIEQEGSPDELYARPRNTFVAGFIGSPRMNFLEGQAREGVVRIKGGPDIGGRTIAPQPVTVGLRPEHLVPPQEGLPHLDLTVDVVENLGGTRFIYGTLQDGTSLVAEARDGRTYQEGKVTRFAFQPSALHLFAADEGRLPG
jgi:lactose/L-arabinose transport system ATP-binding protein